jgi:hypothetical protein
MLWIVDRGGPQGTVSKWQCWTFVFDGNAVDLCHHTISPIPWFNTQVSMGRG